MIRRHGFAGIGVLALLLLAAMPTSVASAARLGRRSGERASGTAVPSASPEKTKPALVLKTPDEGKKEGETIKDGTTVHAGWYIGLEKAPYEHAICQVLVPNESEEGSMVLSTNSSEKDKATGSVAAPPCGEPEEYEEGGKKLVRLKKVEGLSLSGGPMKEQEVTTKHKGTIELTAPLILHTESGTTKCAFESKTKIDASWPPKYTTEEPGKAEEEEAFPFLEDTANLVVEPELKLDKSLSSKSGCAKGEKVAMETWLGPLGAELEADLT